MSMTDQQPAHIVLVEDEEILANILGEKLTKAGYRVTVCRDGEEGITTILRDRPALILLDILLPKKNGYEVLNAMTEAGMLPTTPVIVISNSGQPVEVDHLMKLGIRDYLVKINFDPDEVLAKVVNTIGSPPQVVAPLAQPTATPQAAAPSTKAKAVLVVEDDIFIADLLCRKLHEVFTVHQASDTSIAEKILAEHHVDVICLDIILPGKDGYTFLKELKAHEKYKTIPVIILSNLGQREEIERGIKSGAADYLIKANSSPEEILRHVSRLVG
jgi:DNA-binding response OmpR family regulator